MIRAWSISPSLIADIAMCIAVAEDEQANQMIWDRVQVSQLSNLLTSIHYQGGPTQVESEWHSIGSKGNAFP